MKSNYIFILGLLVTDKKKENRKNYVLSGLSFGKNFKYFIIKPKQIKFLFFYPPSAILFPKENRIL